MQNDNINNNDETLAKIKKENPMLGDKYKLLDKIGEGSFGEVYFAIDKSKKKYAIKTEEKKKRCKLQNEYNVYRRIFKQSQTNSVENIIGIPKVYDLIETPQYMCMAMELLGPSLDKKFLDHDKVFSLDIVFKIALDSINLIKIIHKAGFIHRDIKPNNFLLNKKCDKLYIMDFGLSKQYISSKGIHMAYRQDRSLIGTVRYTSINVHNGFEPSRRDDLESIAIMLVYFAKGSLPWQGLKKDKHKTQIQKIGDVKLCTDIDKLCDGLPPCFPSFIKYCRELKFAQDPDYNFIIESFEDSIKKLNIKPCYNWKKIEGDT